MPTLSNGRFDYEAGQTAYPMSQLTDSGDAKTFEFADAPLSRVTGYAPVILPDGLATGGKITPAASGDDDAVDVAAGTAYIGGALVTWTASADVAITRGVTTDTHAITSITITGAGVVAAVAGTDHTAFSETRDATGGPPLIATTSIEIGQIRTTSVTAAAILQSEIHQVSGLHCERYDWPMIPTPDYTAGKITFIQALPAIHTGPTTKGVYASYATPIFAEVPHADNITAPSYSYSTNPVETFSGTKTSEERSLGAASFDVYLNDGMTDNLMAARGQTLWFKMLKNRDSDVPYTLFQGKLGIPANFKVSGLSADSCTISPEGPAVIVTA